jgi:hypothetical protein
MWFPLRGPARSTMPATEVTTRPRVVVGQEWSSRNTGRFARGTERVRIVCRYPFTKRGVERLWVVERLDRVQSLERIPERTLRECFTLVRSSS